MYSQYAHNEDGVEYPSAHKFYCHSNTHNPDKDRFEDLYCWDFVHAISWVARRRLAHHHLDPYQCAAFCHSIVRHNTGEEEADPTLELAMEYAGALGTIIFNESYHLHDLTEAQVGRNQFAMDVAVDQLDNKIDEVDRRADQVSEQLLALEGQVTDIAEGYHELLALDQEQTATSVQACRAIMALSTITMAQQDQVAALRVRVAQAEERMDVMQEMILVSWGPAFGQLPLCLSLQPKRPWSRYPVWFPLDSNPRLGFSASSGISGWSAGVRVSMGAGHMMAYAATGLR